MVMAVGPSDFDEVGVGALGLEGLVVAKACTQLADVSAGEIFGEDDGVGHAGVEAVDGVIFTDDVEGLIQEEGVWLAHVDADLIAKILSGDDSRPGSRR